MKCPKCEKGELEKDINYEKLGGGIWEKKYYKTYLYFCPLCDFEKEKEIEISEDQYKREIEKEESEADIDLSFKAKGKKK